MAITEFAGPDHQYEWDPETGAPGIGLFSNALQVWAIAQDRTVTVAEAALAFVTSPDLIRAAVEDHHWMYLDGDTTQHEGE